MYDHHIQLCNTLADFDIVIVEIQDILCQAQCVTQKDKHARHYYAVKNACMPDFKQNVYL